MPRRPLGRNLVPRRKKPSLWKGAEEVARLKFSLDFRGLPVRIGGHAYGDVYVGRIYFKDGKSSRVAVKTFKKSLNDWEAGQYRQVIADLRNAGVRLPRMGMAKVRTRERPEGEWVQVSQLFGSTRGSKMHDKYFHGSGSGRRLSMADMREVIREGTKIANAGYLPALDFFEPFRLKAGIVPMDLDSVVEKGRRAPADAAGKLVDNIIACSDYFAEEAEGARSELCEVALREASPEIKRLLLERLKKKV